MSLLACPKNLHYGSRGLENCGSDESGMGGSRALGMAGSGFFLIFEMVCIYNIIIIIIVYVCMHERIT